MKTRKNSFSINIFIIIIGLLVIGFTNTFVYGQEIPTPNCVCAECNKKCGTGHEKTCKYYNPKAQDGIKNLFEKSETDFASMENFSVYTDNGFYVKVTNKNNFAVKYSFEYDLKDKDTVITYTCTDYIVSANTVVLNLFTATNTTKVTRILVTAAGKYEN